MAKAKVKPNWMIMLMAIGGLFYGISCIDAALASNTSTFEFIGFEIGKWLYMGMTLFFSFSLFSLSRTWYKQRKAYENKKD